MSDFKEELDAYMEGERAVQNDQDYDNPYDGLLGTHYDRGYNGKTFEPQGERI